MGTYRLSVEEIADILESLEDSGKFEGDFTEKDFLKGAKLFIDRLRNHGAWIAK